MTKTALFIGHGSPMNALADHAPAHAWQAVLRELGPQVLPGMRAILCVSAHWQTRGTEVFASHEPHAIHDFIGFPKSLYDVKYLAPGAVAEAKALSAALSAAGHEVPYTAEWGYDHGVWSVLAHLAPHQNIPVFMLSLDRRKTLDEHLALARAVGAALPEDILIVASGNIVHALADMEEDPMAAPPPWAVEFDEQIAKALEQRDWTALTEISRAPGTPGKLSVPTLDHYIPLLYAAGFTDAPKHLTFPYSGFDHGTISMRCVCIRE
jgi:4,5-DOPA dioxygenase extradiol